MSANDRAVVVPYSPTFDRHKLASMYYCASPRTGPYSGCRQKG